MRRWAILPVILYCQMAWAQRMSDLVTPRPLPSGATLVVGFLGGFDRWNDPHKNVRKLVLRLRQRPGVYAESISNHHRPLAMALVREALDTNRDGKLDADEKANARIIVFGQSFGGAAAIFMARDLEQMGIPVMLTVQVDSVGRHDEIVPANVRAAVNFFQRDPFTVRGRPKIRAADPSKTMILGNFESSYVSRSVDQREDSWIRRTFAGSHAKMQADPEIWRQVERYITDAIAGRRP